MPQAGASARHWTHSAASVPLADFAKVDTCDLDEAASVIGRIFCPHLLDPLQKSAPDFRALHNSAAYDGFSINFVAYGGTVSIDPGCLDRFFLLQIPVTGGARVWNGAEEVNSSAGNVATVLSPTLPTRMIWQDSCAQIIVLLDRKIVEKRASALADAAVPPVEFAPALTLGSPFGKALAAQAEYLVDAVERSGSSVRLPAAFVANCREAMLGLLLTGQASSLTPFLERAEKADVVPGVIKRARDYLEAHAAEPLDLEALANAAGAGLRSVQIGFRRHYGLSISETLLEIRLRRLHAALKASTPGMRIASAAFELGFTHLGRMAECYKARFGEHPSDTLARAQ